MKFLSDITAEEVRAAVAYNPETGTFTRVVRGIARQTGSKSCGHVVVWVSGRLYKAHRLAWLYMTGEWPPEEIDHINQNGQDNRWCNLRLASRAENTMNRHYRRKQDLPRGVTFDANKYRATIRIDGKHRHLGRFNTPEEAHAAYLSAVPTSRRAFLPQECSNAVAR